jgi:hypothetical protein
MVSFQEILYTGRHRVALIPAFRSVNSSLLPPHGFIV